MKAPAVKARIKRRDTVETVAMRVLRDDGLGSGDGIWFSWSDTLS